MDAETLGINKTFLAPNANFRFHLTFRYYYYLCRRATLGKHINKSLQYLPRHCKLIGWSILSFILYLFAFPKTDQFNVVVVRQQTEGHFPETCTSGGQERKEGLEQNGKTYFWQRISTYLLTFYLLTFLLLTFLSIDIYIYCHSHLMTFLSIDISVYWHLYLLAFLSIDISIH